MGSILGSVVTASSSGDRGLTKLYYPPASNTVISW